MKTEYAVEKFNEFFMDWRPFGYLKYHESFKSLEEAIQVAKNYRATQPIITPHLRIVKREVKEWEVYCEC